MHLLTHVLAIALLISLVFIIYNFSYKNQNNSMDFTFSWGSDRQKIVKGTFRLGISMKVNGDNVTVVITANDDEYDDYDYVGLVFDTNQNDYIDLNDQSYGLWTNNYTAHSLLLESGFLGWAQDTPVRGPQNVTFDKSSGYTFNIAFPFYYPTNPNKPWYDPAAAIKNGLNQLHVCFYDYNASQTSAGMEGVFTRFNFNVGG
jgi:hypothetical protein